MQGDICDIGRGGNRAPPHRKWRVSFLLLLCSTAIARLVSLTRDWVTDESVPIDGGADEAILQPIKPSGERGSTSSDAPANRHTRNY